MITATERPLVSVVVATYNGGRFLRQQIDSVLAQTYPNLEIIISDDASTDDTVLIAQSYQERQPGIRLLRSTVNHGYIRNFERGLREAKGDYVALCDQDDIWLPEKITVLVEALGHHALVYCDSALIDEAGNSLHRKMSELRNYIDYRNPLMYVIGVWSPGHAMLFRRSLLEGCFPFPGLVTQDFWLSFMASGRGGVHFVNQPLVLYRQHSANAIGGIKMKRAKKRRPSRREQTAVARERMQLLYDHCAPQPANIKETFGLFLESYQSFSFRNNCLRVALFYRYRHLLHASKRKSEFMQRVYALKMFFKLV